MSTMTDLVNCVIEESKWYTYIYINGSIDSIKRRFPPHILKFKKFEGKFEEISNEEYEYLLKHKISISVFDDIRIYNRVITEDEWEHVSQCKDASDNK